MLTLVRGRCRTTTLLKVSQVSQTGASPGSTTADTRWTSSSTRRQKPTKARTPEPWSRAQLQSPLCKPQSMRVGSWGDEPDAAPGRVTALLSKVACHPVTRNLPVSSLKGLSGYLDPGSEKRPTSGVSSTLLQRALSFGGLLESKLIFVHCHGFCAGGDLRRRHPISGRPRGHPAAGPHSTL